MLAKEMSTAFADELRKAAEISCRSMTSDMMCVLAARWPLPWTEAGAAEVEAAAFDACPRLCSGPYI